MTHDAKHNGLGDKHPGTTVASVFDDASSSGSVLTETCGMNPQPRDLRTRLINRSVLARTLFGESGTNLQILLKIFQANDLGGNFNQIDFL